VRFRRPVRPGDRLELHVRLAKAWGPFWRVRGQATVNGQHVAEATLTATLVDAPSSPSESPR